MKRLLRRIRYLFYRGVKLLVYPDCGLSRYDVITSTGDNQMVIVKIKKNNDYWVLTVKPT